MQFRNSAVMRPTHIIGLLAAVAFAVTSVNPIPAVQAQTASLASCPPRQPVLRLAIVSGDESYSTHPAEARFQSTHYSRLHQMPLFGVDPLEDEGRSRLRRRRVLAVPARRQGPDRQDPRRPHLQRRYADHGR